MLFPYLFDFFSGLEPSPCLDLENVILNKNNLLDLIEMKVNEVKLDATKPLVEIGLYRDLTDKVDL